MKIGVVDLDTNPVILQLGLGSLLYCTAGSHRHVVVSHLSSLSSRTSSLTFSFSPYATLRFDFHHHSRYLFNFFIFLSTSPSSGRNHHVFLDFLFHVILLYVFCFGTTATLTLSLYCLSYACGAALRFTVLFGDIFRNVARGDLL